jgi:hypothetical protein
MSVTRPFVFLLLAVGVAGCKLSHPLVGMHCEGGVDGDGRGHGGDCVDIKPDLSAHFASLYQYKFTLRPTATKGRYDLVHEGKAIGIVEHDPRDRWLYVTFKEAPPGSGMLPGSRNGYRDDMPSPFI